MNKLLCAIKTLNKHVPVLVDYSKKGDTACIACENCKSLIKGRPKHVNVRGDVLV